MTNTLVELVGWAQLATGERRPTNAKCRWAGARRAVLAHPTVARRRGIVLVMVLVALGLAAVIGGALLQIVGMERAALAAREQESQARWLAESGVERAAARLAVEPGYTGETWTLSEEELDGRGTGRVTISIANDPANPGRRLVAVEAEFPTSGGRPKRYVKQVEIARKP